MTMREEFEAWARVNHPAAPFLLPAQDVIAALPNAWNTWQAAYRAGQESKLNEAASMLLEARRAGAEAMRERAAKACDESPYTDHSRADRIRALPVD